MLPTWVEFTPEEEAAFDEVDRIMAYRYWRELGIRAPRIPLCPGRNRRLALLGRRASRQRAYGRLVNYQETRDGLWPR